MKIKQVAESEVLRLLVQGYEVFRFRKDMKIVVNLMDETISNIRNRLAETKHANFEYVYFVLTDEE